MKKINAFILAAGRGERLGPITGHIPKPLLPILGRPIIDLIISKLSLLNPERYAVNVHYKSDLLSSYLSTVSPVGKIVLFPERTLLGTGGALKNAASLLRQGIFIAHNADILSDIDLKRLLDYHSESGHVATLAVHDYPLYNNVWIDRDGNLLRIGSSPPGPHAQDARCIAFTGIAAYSPEFLDYLPDGFSHVTDAWQRAAADGQVSCLDFTGSAWSDIGTPAAYAKAVFSALRVDGETIFIHPSADCGEALFGFDAILEKEVSISGAPFLKRCIVLPGTSIAETSVVINSINGPDFSISLDAGIMPSSDVLPNEVAASLLDRGDSISPPQSIGSGGSDRRYYRIITDNGSAVLMVSPRQDPDFIRHITFSSFFRLHGLPVPALISSTIGTDPDRTGQQEIYSSALFEDLGDLSLYSWLHCRREAPRVDDIYRRILDMVILLHTRITDNAAECPLLVSRSFDYEHLRWESSYFMEQFVFGVKGLARTGDKDLNTEFDRLAKYLAAEPKTIVHRDCQSQNIMITAGDIPRVIDYQGARLGPPAYDIASLLWDPYVDLPSDQRDHLLLYYRHGMSHESSTFADGKFLESLLPCRLQRHMQALGAYGYLSRVKKKKYFLKFVPRCLRYLQEAATSCRQEYPLLYSMIKAMEP